MSTPRKLIAAIDEYKYMEQIKHYEMGYYNLRFIAPLLVPDQKMPDPPTRKNQPTKEPVINTNDAGIALLAGFGF